MGTSMGGQLLCVSRGDLWPSGAPTWSIGGKGARARMCPALVALTQDMLCLHNADVTLGAATNRDRQNSS